MSKNKKIEKTLLFFVLSVFIIGLFLMLIQNSNAMNQDLGRHLKLGEIILKTKTVPNTNLFTYTHENFPFLNHHWLAEVIFFFVWSKFGIETITFLKIISIVSSAILMFFVGKKYGGLALAALSSSLFLFIFRERIDERPEIFAYLMFAVILFIFSSKKLNKYAFFISPLIMLLWANIHITFIFGLFIITLFLFQKINDYKKGIIEKKHFIILLSLVFASFIFPILNPNGIDGFLYPLKVFENYGYRIIENQSVFFLIDKISNPVISYFIFFLGPISVIVSLVYFYLERKNIFQMKTEILCVLSFFIFTILSFWAIRNFVFFALLGIPAFSIISKKLIGDFIERKTLSTVIVFLSILTISLISLNLLQKKQFYFFPSESYKSGVDFFLSKKIHGNIFNNFDIGGYLDFRLYPLYKTFVDNRPEAFPKEFFDEYIKIQENKKFRDEKFAEYGINSIIFAHRDITPWAQNFLMDIIKDKNWTVQYADSAVIVLEKTKNPALR